MNRNEVLSRAFEAISWSDEPFEPHMGDFDRLSRSVSSSSKIVALHSLARIHEWLWPQVESAPEGAVVTIGDMSVKTIRDDEDCKFVSLHAGGEKWVVAWGRIAGEEPTIGLGLADPSRDSGQRRMAYCTLPPSGIRRGQLMAEGADVGRMFGLFSHLRPMMPAEFLAVSDGSRNDGHLADYELDRVLEIDGGLGGPVAAELHRMAEQHAASVVFRWAAAKYDRVSRFLLEKNIVFGSSAAEFNDGDRIICGVETGDDGQRAIYDSRFPHDRSGNRFLTWMDFSYNGALAAVHSYAIPENERLENVVGLLKSGDLQPGVTHEYASRRTIFSSEGVGMRYLESMANSIAQADYLASRFNPNASNDDYELIAMDDLKATSSIGR
jgi:hypothetical protein